jgi:hypothetical protein
MSTDCLDCIGGMAMDHLDGIGTCFMVCPTCHPACPCCLGRARFPAWTLDMGEFIAAYNESGLMPILCHTCGGYLDAKPIPTDGPGQ